MKIAIGCDPNAEEAKKEIIAYIKKKGYGEVTDFGSEDPIYANVAIDVAEHVASGEYDRGVLICGTGLGVSIAANKVKGAYAALVSMYTLQQEQDSVTTPILSVWEHSRQVQKYVRCWWMLSLRTNSYRDVHHSLK